MAAILPTELFVLREKVLKEAIKHVPEVGFNHKPILVAFDSLAENERKLLSKEAISCMFHRGFPIALVEFIVKDSTTKVLRCLDRKYSKTAVLRSIQENEEAFINNRFFIPNGADVATEATLIKIDSLLPFANRWPEAVALEYCPGNAGYTALNVAEYIDTVAYHVERIEAISKLIAQARSVLQSKQMASFIPTQQLSNTLDGDHRKAASFEFLRAFFQGIPLSSGPHAGNTSLSLEWYLLRGKLVSLNALAMTSLLGDTSKNACETHALVRSTMLSCQEVSGCGRMVVAAKDIRAGEIVFTEAAYVVAPNLLSSSSYCVYCSEKIKGKPQVSMKCSKCGSDYCCTECYEKHAGAHCMNGECSAFCFINRVRSKIPAEDLDTFIVACLILARCNAEGKADRIVRQLGTSGPTSAVETVGLNKEQLPPKQFLSCIAPGSIVNSSYDHVECLVSNWHSSNPDIVDDFCKLYDTYTHCISKRKYTVQMNQLEVALPLNVSLDTFVSICTAFLCNGFGMWDSSNNLRASAVYPQSSYFNHSCAPNLGRRNLKKSREVEFFATRNISAGEPLCISYVDIKLTADERKAKLLATYSFECRCERCLPTSDYLTANTLCGKFFVHLCNECSTKIMQPLADNRFICPYCNSIQ